MTYLLATNVSIWAALGFLALVLALVAWSRRIKFTTQMASQAYFNEGDAEKAQALYEKAYQSGKMSAECKISYAAFCLREKHFEKGRQLLNEVVNSPQTSRFDKLSAAHNLAIIIWKEGKLDEAIERMETICSERKTTDIYGTMGVLYIDKAKRDGVTQEIIDFMLEAYDYDPCDKTIADNLGELYLVMGEDEKAKEVYEKLFEEPISSPVPYYNYGCLLNRLGDKQGACDNFEKALDCRFTSVTTITREQVQKELDSIVG